MGVEIPQLGDAVANSNSAKAETTLDVGDVQRKPAGSHPKGVQTVECFDTLKVVGNMLHKLAMHCALACLNSVSMCLPDSEPDDPQSNATKTISFNLQQIRVEAMKKTENEEKKDNKDGQQEEKKEVLDLVATKPESAVDKLETVVVTHCATSHNTLEEVLTKVTGQSSNLLPLPPTKTARDRPIIQWLSAASH